MSSAGIRVRELLDESACAGVHLATVSDTVRHDGFSLSEVSSAIRDGITSGVFDLDSDRRVRVAGGSR